jgi:hypothetical protein
MASRFFLALLFSAALFAQADRNDGEDHGDAPYLTEDGWQPLFNGNGTSGWHCRPGTLQNEWLTTRGIVFERLLAPKVLSPMAAPGDRLLNGRNGRTCDFVTDAKFGDSELWIEFMVSKGSNSGVYLHGLYEVQIFDSYGATEPAGSSDAGGIYHRWIDNKGVGGSAPSRNVARPPGQWQSYHIWFQGPRFDATGKKTANAKFLRVVFNGFGVQKDVEVDGPTRAAMDHPEAAENPLMLQGDHGPVAFRNIYIRPLRPIVER